MGIVPILGQWRRADKPAEHMQDVGRCSSGTREHDAPS